MACRYLNNNKDESIALQPNNLPSNLYTQLKNQYGKDKATLIYETLFTKNFRETYGDWTLYNISKYENANFKLNFTETFKKIINQTKKKKIKVKVSSDIFKSLKENKKEVTITGKTLIFVNVDEDSDVDLSNNTKEGLIQTIFGNDDVFEGEVNKESLVSLFKVDPTIYNIFDENNNLIMSYENIFDEQRELTLDFIETVIENYEPFQQIMNPDDIYTYEDPEIQEMLEQTDLAEEEIEKMINDNKILGLELENLKNIIVSKMQLYKLGLTEDTDDNKKPREKIKELILEYFEENDKHVSFDLFSFISEGDFIKEHILTEIYSYVDSTLRKSLDIDINKQTSNVVTDTSDNEPIKNTLGEIEEEVAEKHGAERENLKEQGYNFIDKKIKSFIDFTTYEYDHTPDEKDPDKKNTETRMINGETVFRLLQYAMSLEYNSKLDGDFDLIFEMLAENSPQTKALYDKYQKVFEVNPNIREAFLRELDTINIDHITLLYDPEIRKSVMFKSNMAGYDKMQIDSWNGAWNMLLKDIENSEDVDVERETVINNIKGIENLLRKEVKERNGNLSSKNIDGFVERLTRQDSPLNLENVTGIKVSPNFIRYSILQLFKLELDKKNIENQDEYFSLTNKNDVKYLNEINLSNHFGKPLETLILNEELFQVFADIANNKDKDFSPYTSSYKYNNITGDQEKIPGSEAISKLKAIALGNSYFDENIAQTSFKNAAKDTLFGLGKPGYLTKAAKTISDKKAREKMKSGQDERYINNSIITNNFLLNLPEEIQDAFLNDFRLMNINNIAQSEMSGMTNANLPDGSDFKGITSKVYALLGLTYFADRDRFGVKDKQGNSLPRFLLNPYILETSNTSHGVLMPVGIPQEFEGETSIRNFTKIEDGKLVIDEVAKQMFTQKAINEYNKIQERKEALYKGLGDYFISWKAQKNEPEYNKEPENILYNKYDVVFNHNADVEKGEKHVIVTGKKQPKGFKFFVMKAMINNLGNSVDENNVKKELKKINEELKDFEKEINEYYRKLNEAENAKEVKNIIKQNSLKTRKNNFLTSEEARNNFANSYETYLKKKFDVWIDTTLVAEGIVKKNKDGSLENILVPEIVNEMGKANSEINIIETKYQGRLENMLFDYYVNSTFYAIDFNELIGGDMSVRKDGTDLFKRVKGGNSAGSPLAEGKVRVAIMDESTYNHVVHGFMEHADAQTYASMSRFREIVRYQGRLNKSVAQVLQKVQLGLPITKEEREVLDANKATVNSLKDVYFNVNVFHKDSVAFLLPEQTSYVPVVKEKEYQNIVNQILELETPEFMLVNPFDIEGKYNKSKENYNNKHSVSYDDVKSQIDALYKELDKIWLPKNQFTHDLRVNMNNYGVDLLIPPSASKLLTSVKMPSTKVTPSVENGNIEQDMRLGYSSFDIDGAYWREVVEVNSGKKSITYFSQIMRLIEGGHTNENQYVKTQNGEVKTIGSILNDYRTKLGTKRIKSLSHAVSVLQKDANGEYTNESIELFNKKLLTTLKGSGATKMMLSLFKDDNIDKNTPVIADKFIQLFLAHFNKGVLTQKAAGGKFSLESDAGVMLKVKVDEQGNEIGVWSSIELDELRQKELDELDKIEKDYKNDLELITEEYENDLENEIIYYENKSKSIYETSYTKLSEEEFASRNAINLKTYNKRVEKLEKEYDSKIEKLEEEYNNKKNSFKSRYDEVMSAKMVEVEEEYYEYEEFVDEYDGAQEQETEIETAKSIYNKLGNKTKTNNIIIPSNYKYNEFLKETIPQFKKDYKGGIIAFRTQQNNFLDAYNKDNAVGNPFSHSDRGLIRNVGTVQDAVEMFIQWVTADANLVDKLTKEQLDELSKLKEYRIALANDLKSGKFKGKKILYYNELKEPSHATALDYLINKYDWNAKTKTEFKQPTLTKRNIFTVNPKQRADKKATIKASLATQYIGFAEGIANSSTELYRIQAGALANTGNYSSNDVIFVSIGGKRGKLALRKKQQNRTIKEALKAIEAGSTLITDNIEYIYSFTTNKSSVIKDAEKEEDFVKKEDLGNGYYTVYFNPKTTSDSVWNEYPFYNEGEKRLYKNLEYKGYNLSEQTIDGQLISVWTNSGKQSTKRSKTRQVTRKRKVMRSTVPGVKLRRLRWSRPELSTGLYFRHPGDGKTPIEMSIDQNAISNRADDLAESDETLDKFFTLQEQIEALNNKVDIKDYGEAFASYEKLKNDSDVIELMKLIKDSFAEEFKKYVFDNSKITDISKVKDIKMPFELGSVTKQGYAEVMIPRMEDWQYDLTAEDLQKSMVQEALKLFGGRIPSQEYHSMISAKIVDFLPSAKGDVLIAPREIVPLSGADFDIDSVYMIRKSIAGIKAVRTGKDGLLKDFLLPYEFGKNLSKNEIIQIKLTDAISETINEMFSDKAGSDPLYNDLIEARKKLTIFQLSAERADDEGDLVTFELNGKKVFYKEYKKYLKNNIKNIENQIKKENKEYLLYKLDFLKNKNSVNYINIAKLAYQKLSVKPESYFKEENKKIRYKLFTDYYIKYDPRLKNEFKIGRLDDLQLRLLNTRRDEHLQERKIISEKLKNNYKTLNQYYEDVKEGYLFDESEISLLVNLINKNKKDLSKITKLINVSDKNIEARELQIKSEILKSNGLPSIEDFSLTDNPMALHNSVVDINIDLYNDPTLVSIKSYDSDNPNLKIDIGQTQRAALMVKIQGTNNGQVDGKTRNAKGDLVKLFNLGRKFTEKRNVQGIDGYDPFTPDGRMIGYNSNKVGSKLIGPAAIAKILRSKFYALKIATPRIEWDNQYLSEGFNKINSNDIEFFEDEDKNFMVKIHDNNNNPMVFNIDDELSTLISVMTDAPKWNDPYMLQLTFESLGTYLYLISMGVGINRAMLLAQTSFIQIMFDSKTETNHQIVKSEDQMQFIRGERLVLGRPTLNSKGEIKTGHFTAAKAIVNDTLEKVNNIIGENKKSINVITPALDISGFENIYTLSYNVEFNMYEDNSENFDIAYQNALQEYQNYISLTKEEKKQTRKVARPKQHIYNIASNKIKLLGNKIPIRLDSIDLMDVVETKSIVKYFSGLNLELKNFKPNDLINFLQDASRKVYDAVNDNDISEEDLIELYDYYTRLNKIINTNFNAVMFFQAANQISSGLLNFVNILQMDKGVKPSFEEIDKIRASMKELNIYVIPTNDANFAIAEAKRLQTLDLERKGYTLENISNITKRAEAVAKKVIFNKNDVENDYTIVHLPLVTDEIDYSPVIEDPLVQANLIAAYKIDSEIAPNLILTRNNGFREMMREVKKSLRVYAKDNSMLEKKLMSFITGKLINKTGLRDLKPELLFDLLNYSFEEVFNENNVKVISKKEETKTLYELFYDRVSKNDKLRNLDIIKLISSPVYNSDNVLSPKRFGIESFNTKSDVLEARIQTDLLIIKQEDESLYKDIVDYLFIKDGFMMNKDSILPYMDTSIFSELSALFKNLRSNHTIDSFFYTLDPTMSKNDLLTEFMDTFVSTREGKSKVKSLGISYENQDVAKNKLRLSEEAGIKHLSNLNLKSKIEKNTKYKGFELDGITMRPQTEYQKNILKENFGIDYDKNGLPLYLKTRDDYVYKLVATGIDGGFYIRMPDLKLANEINPYVYESIKDLAILQEELNTKHQQHQLSKYNLMSVSVMENNKSIYSKAFPVNELRSAISLLYGPVLNIQNRINDINFIINFVSNKTGETKDEINEQKKRNVKIVKMMSLNKTQEALDGKQQKKIGTIIELENKKAFENIENKGVIVFIGDDVEINANSIASIKNKGFKAVIEQKIVDGVEAYNYLYLDNESKELQKIDVTNEISGFGANSILIGTVNSKKIEDRAKASFITLQDSASTNSISVNETLKIDSEIKLKKERISTSINKNMEKVIEVANERHSTKPKETFTIKDVVSKVGGNYIIPIKDTAKLKITDENKYFEEDGILYKLNGLPFKIANIKTEVYYNRTKVKENVESVTVSNRMPSFNQYFNNIEKLDPTTEKINFDNLFNETDDINVKRKEILNKAIEEAEQSKFDENPYNIINNIIKIFSISNDKYQKFNTNEVKSILIPIIEKVLENESVLSEINEQGGLAVIDNLLGYPYLFKQSLKQAYNNVMMEKTGYIIKFVNKSTAEKLMFNNVDNSNTYINVKSVAVKKKNTFFKLKNVNNDTETLIDEKSLLNDKINKMIKFNKGNKDLSIISLSNNGQNKVSIILAAAVQSYKIQKAYEEYNELSNEEKQKETELNSEIKIINDIVSLYAAMIDINNFQNKLKDKSSLVADYNLSIDYNPTNDKVIYELSSMINKTFTNLDEINNETMLDMLRMSLLGSDLDLNLYNQSIDKLIEKHRTELEELNVDIGTKLSTYSETNYDNFDKENKDLLNKIEVHESQIKILEMLSTIVNNNIENNINDISDSLIKSIKSLQTNILAFTKIADASVITELLSKTMMENFSSETLKQEGFSDEIINIVNHFNNGDNNMNLKTC